MKITVYTVNDCQFSKQEKDYLTSKGLQFEEKNLESNREWLNEMLSVSNNFAGTPVTKIEKDNGQTVVLKGFTQAEFDLELTAAPAMSMDGAIATDTPAAPVPPAPEPAAPTPEPAAPPVVEPPAPAPETPAMPETPVVPPAPVPEPPQQAAPTMSMAPEPPQDPVTPPTPPAPPEPQMPTPMPPTPPTPEPTAPPVTEPPAAPPQQSSPALSSILDQLQNKSATSQPTPPQAYN